MSSIFVPVLELLAVALIVALGFRVNYAPLVVVGSEVFGFTDVLTLRVSGAGFSYEKKDVQNLFVSGLFVSSLIGFVVSPLLGILFPIFSFVVCWVFLGHLKIRKLQKEKMVSDEICYLLARSLRAGLGLGLSLDRAHEKYPTSALIASIITQMRAGKSMTDSLSRVVSDASTQISNSERMLCATLSIAHAMGGNSARIFERIGDSFHQNYELQSDTSSALSQVRMSALVIGFLPIGMLGFSFLLGSKAALFLFTNPIGWACLILGVLLEIGGILWMRKLVRNGVGIWTS